MKRQDILKKSIGDVIEDFKDAMDLANQYGNITATVEFATMINQLDDMVDYFLEVEE